ncbi:MAG: alkylmercury lyase, partial [Deltaproteobacteria bacterium]|nr:alkylmercury lyase [Deltaproteobacteria bacterium]
PAATAGTSEGDLFSFRDMHRSPSRPLQYLRRRPVSHASWHAGLRRTAHRFEVEGRALYTWCALDTLIFPAVLGASARVTSTCYATGAPIQLEVGPEGLSGLAPECTVVSLVVPSDMASVRSAFCSQVHFFASREAAAAWLSEHPTASVVTVAEAYGIGLALAKARFAASPRCC